MSSGRHPAKQLSSSLPSCALRLRLGRLRSSCAGQKDMALSPLRLATSNLSNTSSKSASILGISFERAGRPDKRPAASSPPLKRNLDYISILIIGLSDRAASHGLALPWRLDLHGFVLLGALGVLGCLQHHDALATNEVFWAPPLIGVYLTCDCRCPLVGLGFGRGVHTGEPDNLDVLSIDLEGPHEPIAELGLLLLNVDQRGLVSAVVEDLLDLHVHPETQLLVSFEPVTCNSSALNGL